MQISLVTREKKIYKMFTTVITNMDDRFVRRFGETKVSFVILRIPTYIYSYLSHITSNIKPFLKVKMTLWQQMPEHSFYIITCL